MRHAARTDANQAEICKALRQLGVNVEYIKLPFDLVVYYRGVTAFMEVKTEEGRLTKQQIEFIARWPGPIHIVRTVDEAIKAVMGEFK